MLTSLFKALKKAEEEIGNGANISISTGESTIVFICFWLEDGLKYRRAFSIYDICQANLDNEYFITLFTGICKREYERIKKPVEIQNKTNDQSRG